MFGLVKSVALAGKIAQAAKTCRIAVYNCDQAEMLVKHAAAQKPALVILDWDACEAEAFKVLKELSANADLKSVPVIGYLAGARADLKEEARRAGCLRVYGKTEFGRELEDLLARYAK